jgi:signal transduction histidine kinase
VDGHRDLVVEIGRDVTEERNLFAQLCQREKMASLGLLATGIAHDLASPLTAISTEMELLLEDVALPAVRASFEVVRRNVARMSALLAEMVNFARRRGDDATRVRLADVARDSVTLVRHDRRFRNVRLEVDIPESLPLIRVVEDHLVLVLVNLLSNAADAMVEGGRIRLGGRAVRGGVEVTVSDDGSGMSDEVKRHARTPLFTTKPRGAGTGLGLFVADGIVRDAGGTLSLTSEVGVGTEVAVWLPMVKS